MLRNAEIFKLFVLGLVFGTSVTDAKHKKVAVHPYIVAGHDSTNAKHPYLVLLNIGGLRCGGSIIANNLVLTAAHCLRNKTAKDVSLYYSVTRANDGANAYHAKKIASHPLYNNAFDYDAGLIWVDKIQLDKTKRVIGLADTSYKIEPGSQVTVSGWGNLKEGGNFANVLQEIQLEVVDWNACKNTFKKNYNLTLTKRQWCAGYLGVGGKDACGGDSGGPAVQNNKIVGLVSWSKGCARANAPGVYTDISKVYQWIKDAMASKLK